MLRVGERREHNRDPRTYLEVSIAAMVMCCLRYGSGEAGRVWIRRENERNGKRGQRILWRGRCGTRRGGSLDIAPRVLSARLTWNLWLRGGTAELDPLQWGQVEASYQMKEMSETDLGQMPRRWTQDE